MSEIQPAPDLSRPQPLVEPGPSLTSVMVNTPTPVNFPVAAVSVPGPLRMRRSGMNTFTVKGTAVGAGAAPPAVARIALRMVTIFSP